jgi:hypothetical protein
VLAHFGMVSPLTLGAPVWLVGNWRDPEREGVLCYRPYKARPLEFGVQKVPRQGESDFGKIQSKLVHINTLQKNDALKTGIPLLLALVPSLPQIPSESPPRLFSHQPTFYSSSTILRHNNNQTIAQRMASSVNLINWDQLKPRILQDLSKGKTQQEIRDGLATDGDDTRRVTIR